MSKPTFIIAEAGVNHNGSIDLARQLIDVAVAAGVDAVKFQTWKTELLVTRDAEMAAYQKENTGNIESQFDMLKKLELSYDAFTELKQYCDSKGILFLSTPDEEQSATFLNQLQPIFKIGSGELTNSPFLRHIASFGKPVILSTGMAEMEEIQHALAVLNDAGISSAAITVLHATTQYPTPMQDVNLRAMCTIKNAFPGISVGYSDHTLGIEVPVAAVSLGASVIEKHFTLDKNMAGPDHKASVDPMELASMVRAIRNIELALGTGCKAPAPSEMENRAIVRKSLVAACDIHQGEVLNPLNVSIKRPGNGMSPTRWDEIMGKTASHNYKAGDLINEA